MAALRAGVWGEIVVGLVECAIDGMVKCVLDCALSLIHLLLLDVDFVDTFGTVKVSAVAGDMK